MSSDSEDHPSEAKPNQFRFATCKRTRGSTDVRKDRESQVEDKGDRAGRVPWRCCSAQQQLRFVTIRCGVGDGMERGPALVLEPVAGLAHIVSNNTGWQQARQQSLEGRKQQAIRTL